VVIKAEKPDPSLLSPGSLLPSPATTTTAATAGKKPVQRKGMWTAEEEKYARELIRAFQGGWVEIPDGTFLRTFLSQRLNCSPMRISKKFMIGKQCFSPCVRRGTDAEIRVKLQDHASLLQRFQTEYERSINAPPTRSRARAPTSTQAASRKRPRTAARSIQLPVQLQPHPGFVGFPPQHQLPGMFTTPARMHALAPLPMAGYAGAPATFPSQHPPVLAAPPTTAPPPPSFVDFFSQKAKDTKATADYKYDFTCDFKTDDLQVKVEKLDLDGDAAPAVVFESACAGLAESSLEMPAAHLAFLESVQQQLLPDALCGGGVEQHPEDDDVDFEDDDDDFMGLDRCNDLLSAFDDLVGDDDDDELLTSGATMAEDDSGFGSDIDLDLSSPSISPPCSPGFMVEDDEHQVLVAVDDSHANFLICANCSSKMLPSHKFCCECGAKAS
jgi:hypothetical protein